MKKVYVLTEIDTCNWGLSPHNVYVFSDLASANRKMKELYDKVAVEGNPQCEFEENHCATVEDYYLDIFERWVDFSLEKEISAWDGILLVNKEFFGDEEEHEVAFSFRDGFAESPTGIRMTYPKLSELTEEQIEQIIAYVGDRITDTNVLIPEDVAMKFGKPEFPKPAYFWTARSNDNSYHANSFEKGIWFSTEKAAYDHMRDAALEKMKWNTEYDEDFDSQTEFIGYDVEFSRDKIVHRSYSGVYTYTIHKGEYYRDFILTAEKGENGWQGFADKKDVTLNTPCMWDKKYDAMQEIRGVVDDYLDADSLA